MVDVSFSKNSFYGSKCRTQDVERRARLLRCERDLKKNVLLPVYQPRFDSPSSSWHVFYRQHDALTFARSQACKDIHVFAFESITLSEQHGQRLYLACSYEHFWHYYSKLPAQQRHHYEVIPEDAACHLYFDLEFDRQLNADHDGGRMVDVFLQYMCFWIQKVYSITCTEADVLLLDASTDLKFSQHAIFHIPGAAFRNNIAAGRFVHHVHSQLKADIETQRLNKENEPSTDAESESGFGGLHARDLQQLFVRHSGGESVFFCDLGVYTRNRNFRLLSSTKLGKSSGELKVAPENQFHPRSSVVDCSPAKCSRLRQRVKSDLDQHSLMEQTFLDSLICNVKFHDDVTILDFDTKPNESRPSHLRLRESSVAGGAESSGRSNSSPFPAIDQFVTSVVRSLGNKEAGAIWRWAYFSTGQLLVYDIIHNRWCANVQREHRSNNIIIVVDLCRGIYYQKCHDPDCRAANFKSPEYNLPSTLLEQTRAAVDEQPNEVDDAELLQAVMAMERTESDSELSDNELLSAVIGAEESCLS